MNAVLKKTAKASLTIKELSSLTKTWHLVPPRYFRIGDLTRHNPI